MKVAIIGTGNMGTGLGRQFAAGGHEVIVGSRDAQRARAKAAEIGASGAGTLRRGDRTGGRLPPRRQLVGHRRRLPAARRHGRQDPHRLHAARNPQTLSDQQTHSAHLQALRETGATGLEPATSGVTGRVKGHDRRRRLTRNRSIHAALRAYRASITHCYAELTFGRLLPVCCPLPARLLRPSRAPPNWHSRPGGLVASARVLSRSAPALPTDRASFVSEQQSGDAGHARREE